MPQGTASLIRHVTRALLLILERAVDGILDPSEVRAEPPETVPLLSGNQQRLVLYLYRLQESPELKNQGPDFEVLPATNGAPPVRIRRDPLALNLHYLLIPFSGREAFLETYEILGAAVRAFHDHGIFSPGALGLPGLTQEEAELEFRLTQEPLGTDELSNIWEAVDEPYRLSVSYCVRTAQIESGLVLDEQRVTTRTLTAEER